MILAIERGIQRWEMGIQRWEMGRQHGVDREASVEVGIWAGLVLIWMFFLGGRVDYFFPMFFIIESIAEIQFDYFSLK